VTRGPWRELGLAALIAAAGWGVSAVRAELATTHAHVREVTDAYPLPPPDETVVLSLGYRAALADVLWAHVLVSQGLHLGERRRFDNLTRFIDTINALDPTFREPYRLTDALVTLQTGKTSRTELQRAREIMERGVAARPLDGELWLLLGQFVAFIAPAGYLTDEAEKKQWREEGARFLAHAAELSGDDSSIAWQALGGTGILSRAGERDAAIRFLLRTRSVTDDEELREKLQTQLDALLGEEQAEAMRRQEAAFNRLWRDDLPFIDKTAVLVLGPPRDPRRCAGRKNSAKPECAATWREWAERSGFHPNLPEGP
jgi:hypothetical protein